MAGLVAWCGLSVSCVVGGWAFFRWEVIEMFYRIIEMAQDGQRITFEYEHSDRDKMLEWVKLLLAQSDVAYVHVMLIDDEGTLLRQKLIEGAAYEYFIDNL